MRLYWIQLQNLDKTYLYIINQMTSNTRKTFIALFIAFVVVGAFASALGFDVSNSVIQSNREWTRVKLGLTGAPGPYQISYDQYPEGWNPVLDYIYIPANQRTVNRKYPCRVSARAQDGSEAKATVVFIVSNEGAYLSDLLFSYNEAFDDSFYNSGIFSGRPKLVRGTLSQAGIIIPQNAQFIKQSNIILRKLNSVSNVPGAGIADLLSGLSGSNDKIEMADVKASLKLRDALASANLANSVTGSGSIQGAAAAFNAAGTNLAVPVTITLSPDERQLVLINQIRNSQIQERTQQRSIESIFFKLPGPQQLDAIITTADSFALIKTIQKVISSELTCEQKISYLSDFFGRIQSAISMKAFAATQLKVIIDGSQGQINRLTKQIARNQQAINKLGVKQIRQKLTQALKQLQIAYTKYNDEQTKVVPKVASIDVLRKNIQTIRTRSQSNRQELPVQKLQLNEVNSNIARIQAQLRAAIANRTVYETNIKKLTQTVSKYDTTIQGYQTNIDQLEAQIINKQNEASNLKQSYQTLEVEIERSRKQITVREKRSAEIQALIVNLQQRLAIQQRKVNNTEIQKIRTFVSSLQTIVSNVTAQIDQVNFRCNQIKQVQTVKNENQVRYVFQPRQYTNYIQNCFKVRPDTKNIKVDRISLNPISILNSAWTKSYGNPYEDDDYINTNEFDFNQDFGCLSPSSLTSNSGLIVKIGKRYIDIKVNDQPSRLNLGACSRLESTSDLPQVGQRIYFRGQRVKNNEYNLYRGSCM